MNVPLRSLRMIEVEAVSLALFIHRAQCCTRSSRPRNAQNGKSGNYRELYRTPFAVFVDLPIVYISGSLPLHAACEHLSTGVVPMVFSFPSATTSRWKINCLSVQSCANLAVHPLVPAKP